MFDQRTDETSSSQYFQFYALLSQQQNMMQDYIRTATYQRAILDNSIDFEGKVRNLIVNLLLLMKFLKYNL